MSVREFRKEDINSLRNIYLETRKQAFSWLNGGSLELKDFDRDTEGERIWVYEMPKGIAGFVSVWEPDNFIHHLFVLPEFYKQGYGSQLLDACMLNINKPIRLKCVSQNIHALEFYRSKGWRTISKGVSADGEYQLMEFSET